jgi:hypothetical protein
VSYEEALPAASHPQDSGLMVRSLDFYFPLVHEPPCNPFECHFGRPARLPTGVAVSPVSSSAGNVAASQRVRWAVLEEKVEVETLVSVPPPEPRGR